jgi:hypothetical protein
MNNQKLRSALDSLIRKNADADGSSQTQSSMQVLEDNLWQAVSGGEIFECTAYTCRMIRSQPTAESVESSSPAVVTVW